MLKKQLPIIFIGLCVVVAMLVLGWAVFIKSTPVVPVQAPVVDNGNDETEIVPDDDISKIDTSDWKVYRNEEYGYELKYPSNWLAYDHYYDGKKHSEDLYIQNFSRPEEGGFSGIGGTGCQFNIWAESDRYLSIQEWIDVQKNSIGKDLEKVLTKKVKVGETEGLEVTFLGSFLGTEDSVIVIINNKVLCRIGKSWQDVPRENCQLIFSGILSTFKFTEE